MEKNTNIICLGLGLYDADKIGPLVAETLKAKYSSKLKNIIVHGGLKNPIHHINFNSLINDIESKKEDIILVGIHTANNEPIGTVRYEENHLIVNTNIISKKYSMCIGNKESFNRIKNIQLGFNCLYDASMVIISDILKMYNI